MLYCVECGCCSGELGQGWSAFVSTDPDGIEPDGVVVYCPICAAAEFGFKPDFAAKYVRGWEPTPSTIVERE